VRDQRGLVVESPVDLGSVDPREVTVEPEVVDDAAAKTVSFDVTTNEADATCPTCSSISGMPG